MRDTAMDEEDKTDITIARMLEKNTQYGERPMALVSTFNQR